MTIIDDLRGRADYEEQGGKESEFEISAKFTADMMRRAASEIERLRDALNCILAAQDLGPSEMTAARDKAEAALQPL